MIGHLLLMESSNLLIIKIVDMSSEGMSAPSLLQTLCIISFKSKIRGVAVSVTFICVQTVQSQ